MSFDILKKVDNYIFAVGRLSMDTPALTRTVNGTVTTPTLLIDENGQVANIFREGTLFTVDKKGTESPYLQTPHSEMIRPKRRILSLAVHRENGTKWIPLEAWENIAKYIHLYCKKGDLVAVVGRIRTITESDSGRESTICSIDQIQLINTKTPKRKDEYV